ncbi:MAG: tRNA lysidine(34) synthetase TilS [Balneolales bacterium]
MKKSEFIKSLDDNVLSILQQSKLQDDALFIVGVSGGPDSMVLLYILHKLNRNILAAHVNYKKREESDHDEKLVKSFCKNIGVRCLAKVAKPNLASGNFQNWARDLRRDFFKDLKKQYNAKAILTAHHKHDQIETLMQKVLRGSSISAWGGIQEFDGDYLRPLLDISKDEILNYASLNKVPYSIDYTNLESNYSRNFIRNDWKPRLDELFPGWEKNILRLRERSLEFKEMLEVTIDSIKINENKLHRDGLLKLKSNARKAVILKFIRQLYPEIKISTSALDSLDLVNLQIGQFCELNAKLSITRDRETFAFCDCRTKRFSYLLDLQKLERTPFKAEDYIFNIEPFIDPDFKNKLYLNVEKLTPQIVFRSWNPGDRFQPFGFKGTKKISDYLTEKKISPSSKRQAGVIASFNGKINGIIFPQNDINQQGEINDEVRCEEGIKKCLVIKRLNSLDEK